MFIRRIVIAASLIAVPIAFAASAQVTPCSYFGDGPNGPDNSSCGVPIWRAPLEMCRRTCRKLQPGRGGGPPAGQLQPRHRGRQPRAQPHPRRRHRRPRRVTPSNDEAVPESIRPRGRFAIGHLWPISGKDGVRCRDLQACHRSCSRGADGRGLPVTRFRGAPSGRSAGTDRFTSKRWLDGTD